MIEKVLKLLKEGLSFQQAANQLGVHTNTIRYQMDKAGIKIDRGFINKIKTERLIAILSERSDLSVEKVCEEARCSIKHFYNSLKSSPELREVYDIYFQKRKQYRDLNKHNSFYVDQLIKKGYSANKIRGILGFRKTASLASILSED